jgi:hypothetical protein
MAGSVLEQINEIRKLALEESWTWCGERGLEVNPENQRAWIAEVTKGGKFYHGAMRFQLEEWLCVKDER